MKETILLNLNKTTTSFALLFILFTFTVLNWLYGLNTALYMTIGSSTLVATMLVIYANRVKGKEKAEVSEILASNIRWIIVVLVGNIILLVSRIIKNMDYVQDVFATITLTGILILFIIISSNNKKRH